MKKMNMLILGMLCCLSTIAQQEPLSNVVNINVPKGAVKLNKEQIISHSKKKFKTSEIASVKTKNLYKIDELLIGFWDLEVSEENKKSLQAIKSEALELYKLDKNIIVNEARINKINNNQFLVINYQNGDASYYRFNSEYRNNQSISGVIQFKEFEKDKAAAILNDILNSIKFK